MKLGDVVIGSGWKSTLIRVIFGLVVIGTAWLAWQDYQATKKALQETSEQASEIEQQYKALEQRIEETRQETERRLEDAKTEAQQQAASADLSDIADFYNRRLDSGNRR
jgi:cytoskeletal protein RodZ